MRKHQTALLAAAMVIAAAAGSWFLFSPSLENSTNLDKQAELLDSIETGGGAVVIDEAVKAYAIDFYDEPLEESGIITPPETEPVIETEPEATEAPEATETTGTGVLTIDKIDLKLPVVDGISNEQLKIAVGCVPKTAAIGETGNAVIAGHRSYTYGQYFNRLGEMEIGDTICYTPKGGETMTFEVFEITEILPGDQIAFIQPEDEAIITLYTCTPIKIASHRLLVRAARII